MSTDIQEPDLSLNVKESRGNKKNRGEKEDTQVEIYENDDTWKRSHIDLGSYKVLFENTVSPSPDNTGLCCGLKLGGPHTQNRLSAVYRRHFSTASILGVLYLLILAGIFLRTILATLDNQSLMTEKEQLNISLNQAQTRIINLTEERDDLQARYDNLSKSYSQLESERNTFKTDLAERDQLIYSLNQAQTRITNLTEERDELQTRFDTLSKSRGPLKTELNNPMDALSERGQLIYSLNQEQTRITNLTEERDELQTRFDTLSKSRGPLKTELNNPTDALSAGPVLWAPGSKVAM